MSNIFHDCDIRGVYGRDLDEDTAYRLGRATGARLAGRDVVVGGDLRPSTPSLKTALIRGLMESGARVIDLGQVPTPAFYHAKADRNADGGVMVTASHNPAPYNGFKLILGDLPITPEDVQALAQEMESGEWPTGRGAYEAWDPLPGYQGLLESSFGGLLPRRIVVDAGNGSLSLLAPAVLRRMGQQVVELFCEPDGTFPGRDPNPAVPAHLAELRRVVVAEGADGDQIAGVAYDGDGDRVIFCDGRGQVQPADRTLVLFIRHLLAQHPGGKVVYDLKSSSVVEEETRAAGGVPLREKSGHAFIKRRLLTEGAVLGGELSGHYFFRALGGDDALYATLLLLRILDELGTTYAEAMDTVPAYAITPDLRLPCPPEEARRIIEELAAALAHRPLDRLDGVRVDFGDGWALARLSVTEPLITLRFEARTEARLAEIQREVRAASPRLDALFAATDAAPRRR